MPGSTRTRTHQSHALWTLRDAAGPSASKHVYVEVRVWGTCVGPIPNEIRLCCHWKFDDIGRTRALVSRQKQGVESAEGGLRWRFAIQATCIPHECIMPCLKCSVQAIFCKMSHPTALAGCGSLATYLDHSHINE